MKPIIRRMRIGGQGRKIKEPEMNDCTPQEQDSGRITTSSDVIADLHDEIERLERSLSHALASAAQPYDHGPQAATLEEAVADVGKWLNERPSRPLDLRSVAMLVAAAQQPREPLKFSQRKALAICTESQKVSVSEVQRKMQISYAAAQELCQSLVDYGGLVDGFALSPSLKPAHKEQG